MKNKTRHHKVDLFIFWHAKCWDGEIMGVIKSYQKIDFREHNFTGLLKTPSSLSLINYFCFPIFWKKNSLLIFVFFLQV